MACGGCKKSRKAFKHRLRKANKKAKKVEVEPKETVNPVESVLEPAPKKQKKKKRGISKRAKWLKEKRRAERHARIKDKQNVK